MPLVFSSAGLSVSVLFSLLHAPVTAVAQSTTQQSCPPPRSCSSQQQQQGATTQPPAEQLPLPCSSLVNKKASPPSSLPSSVSNAPVISPSLEFRCKIASCLPPFWDSGILWEIAGSRNSVALPKCVLLSPQGNTQYLPSSHPPSVSSAKRLCASFMAGVSFLAARQAAPDALSWTEKQFAAGVSTVSCGRTLIYRLPNAANLPPQPIVSNSPSLPPQAAPRTSQSSPTIVTAASTSTIPSPSLPKPSPSGLKQSPILQPSVNPLSAPTSSIIRNTCADFGLMYSPSEISLLPPGAESKLTLVTKLRDNNNNSASSLNNPASASVMSSNSLSSILPSSPSAPLTPLPTANSTTNVLSSNSSGGSNALRSVIVVYVEDSGTPLVVPSCFFDETTLGVSLAAGRILTLVEDATPPLPSANSTTPWGTSVANQTTVSPATTPVAVPLSMSLSGGCKASSSSQNVKKCQLGTLQLQGIGKFVLETIDPCAKRKAIQQTSTASSIAMPSGAVSAWRGGSAAARLAAQGSAAGGWGSLGSAGGVLTGNQVTNVNTCSNCVSNSGVNNYGGVSSSSSMNVTTSGSGFASQHNMDSNVNASTMSTDIKLLHRILRT
eukprot:GDKK01060291.1.p1 GENE.GDKK01060291.1~~GDKK01060291.1.p1  ORF type:complete len:608 (-),score=143.61 GDKK01060291.1:39-1862(-)